MSRYLSPLLVVLVILAVLAGSVYLYLKIFRSVPDLPDPEMPTVSPVPKGRITPPPPPPPLILPALDESDDFIRPLVEEVSSHPRLMAWLVNGGLVRRFVTAVDNTSRGESPRLHVPFIELEGGFEVGEKNGRKVISEASFRRYDFLTAVVASLDTTGSVRLFRDLEPLFEEAYGELGNPDTFEEALVRTIDRLVDVEIPEGEIEVSERLQAYGFADRRLEKLSPAEKHLLRMGPENAREIQAKLLTFKTALTLTRSGD